MKRIAITGIGVISPLGNELETFWKNLTAGVSGISRITSLDPSDYDCQIAGEVRDFEPAGYFKNPKDARRADRFSQFAIAAAKMAVEDSGIDFQATDCTRAGVMVGSGIGGLATLENCHSTLINRGPRKVTPFMIPMMISNMASGLISMEYGLQGPNMSIVTACATANQNIGEAWRMMQFGDADVFIAGGAEATIAPTGLAGFCSMKALSRRNDAPEKASRPFDRDRDGFVMGEGAGVILMETLEHAQRRGAKIYAELSGYGVSADAYHMTSPLPDGAGASRCMDMALHHARLNPEDIDYINAHGTSTGLGDICETIAIKKSFGDHAKSGLLVSSTKSMTGHLLGAAGGVEAAASLLTIRDQVVAPTINLDNPDPECDLDYVPHEAREAKIDAVISNSFGFGGHNASLVFEKYNG